MIRPPPTSTLFPYTTLFRSQTTVRVATFAHCETCKGNGAEPGSQPARCRACQGHGRVRAQQGFFTIERTCPDRKSTRLNSSHRCISYAVFCLKKKKKNNRDY